mmetsp:Transcript_24244/g.71328  ORF Transcript_24244/g.71328 Transcript_24244/m.71328 type:complete len:93 (-) Transcript_24244:1135-1413(-)
MVCVDGIKSSQETGRIWDTNLTFTPTGSSSKNSDSPLVTVTSSTEPPGLLYDGAAEEACATGSCEQERQRNANAADLINMTDECGSVSMLLR